MSYCLIVRSSDSSKKSGVLQILLDLLSTVAGPDASNEIPRVLELSTQLMNPGHTGASNFTYSSTGRALNSSPVIMAEPMATYHCFGLLCEV